MKTFKKKEVVRISGLSPSTVQFYSDRGAVAPIEGGGGRGIKLYFDEEALFLLCIIKQMYDFGMTIARILDVVKFIADQTKGTLDTISAAREAGGGMFFISIKIENKTAIPLLKYAGRVSDIEITSLMADSDAVLLIDGGRILDKVSR